jgi:transposase InsO family protein
VFSGQDVAEALDRAIARAGTPPSITVDHGTEFTSRALDERAYPTGASWTLSRLENRFRGQVSAHSHDPIRFLAVFLDVAQQGPQNGDVPIKKIKGDGHEA